MAVPPELFLESDTDTDRFNSLIGAKIMTIVSLPTIIVYPEKISILPSSDDSISPGITP